MTKEQALALAAARLRAQQQQQAPKPPSGPTEEQELLASSPVRGVKGVRDVIDAGAQMLTHALPDSVVEAVNSGVAKVNELPVIGPATVALGMTPATSKQIDRQIASDEKNYQAARKATTPRTLSNLVAGQQTDPGIDLARLGGNIAVTAPMVGGKLLSGGGKLLARALRSVPGGAAFGITQPVAQNQDNFAEEKGLQALTGAVAAPASALATEGVARVISPVVRDSVKKLMSEGVTPTVGQILGGLPQRLEEKLTSVPIIGDAIASAHRKGIDELNRAMYARALRPIGGDVPKTVGREAVESVKTQLGEAYDRLLPNMKFVSDPQFQAQMASLNALSKNLPREEARQFQNIIKSEITDRLTGMGRGSGETLKLIESQLNKEIGRFSKSQDAYQQKLGQALTEALHAFRGGIARSNPQFADALAKINQGYANFARIRDAASRMGSDQGVITPVQLAAAVRAGDKTVGKGGFATGNAFMQDLADAGKDVLARKYPDSGTAGRIATMGAAGGGAYFLDPMLLATMGAASAPFLPVGRQAMAALLARRPQVAGRLAEGVRRLPAPAAVPLAQALLQSNE